MVFTLTGLFGRVPFVKCSCRYLCSQFWHNSLTSKQWLVICSEIKSGSLNQWQGHLWRCPQTLVWTAKNTRYQCWKVQIEHYQKAEENLVTPAQILVILFIVRHSFKLIITFPVCGWQDVGKLVENWNGTFRLDMVDIFLLIFQFLFQNI